MSQHVYDSLSSDRTLLLQATVTILSEFDGILGASKKNAGGRVIAVKSHYDISDHPTNRLIIYQSPSPLESMSFFSHIYRSLSSSLKLPTTTITNNFSTSSSRTMAVKDFVDNTIQSNKIVVFSKSFCPFCKATKSYFSTQYPEETVKVVELDDRDDGDQIQDYLLAKTGARSVPRTFINGYSVGGNSDLQALPRPKVKALIDNVATA